MKKRKRPRIADKVLRTKHLNKEHNFKPTLWRDKLNLDSVQTIQVEAINLKYAQKLEVVMDGNGRKLSKLRQMISLQQQKNKELKKVFNAEQYKEYLQFEEKMKKRFKDGKKSRNQ